MEINSDWKEVKVLFKKSFRSSFHFSIASITPGGEPHVTPIGSLIPGEPGHAIYFEKFTQQLPLNISANKQICVLAVNSSKWFWLQSLLGGKFTTHPAIRLYGVAGELRKATDQEIHLWQKRVKSLSFSKGHSMMWKSMSMVREVKFTRIESVKIGAMTRGL